MGGPGSSRWTTTVSRLTTDGLLRLDVRALARAGALQPGVSATVRWDGLVSVTTSVAPEAPDGLVVAYGVWADTGAWMPVTERLQLSRTLSTFGGDRPWFLCPNCGSRRAVLYGVGGWFRCRECHHLTYPSTRATR